MPRKLLQFGASEQVTVMGRFGQLQAGQAASIQSRSGRGEVVFHSFMALVQRGKKEAHQHAGATDTRMSLTWGIERGV